MLTTDEAGRLLRRSGRTLARWRVRGEGPPYHRHGLGRVLYDPNELRAWAKANRVVIWEDEEDTADAAS